MICVECGQPVTSVYRRLTQNKFRLTYCDHCKHIADKYIEYEFILIFFDLLLLFPQPYRHILFNKSADETSHALAPKLLIAIILFDAYVLSVQGPSTTWGSVGFGDYFLGLLQAGFGFAAFFIGCWIALKFLAYHVPNSITVSEDKLALALIVSSFGKCFVLLMVIWDYPPAFSVGLDLFVWISNTVAVGTLMHTSWRQAITPVVAGLCLRFLSKSFFLGGIT